MQLKVNNCGECPFMQTSQDLDAFCNHPDYKNDWEELPDYNDMVIHKDCPEGGASDYYQQKYGDEPIIKND